jgi:6-pyruvoyltetrahydropterin/6-carboxytetrahydropterin synthase
MYTIAVRRDFIARHFLTGGDWGDENRPHAHHYILEVSIKGTELDQHGYLVDIVVIEEALAQDIAYFLDSRLNDLPEFKELNPSMEHFCRIIWCRLRDRIKLSGAETIRVKLWENESCWAAYTLEPG